MNTSLTEVKIDELFDLNLNISYIDLESFESTVLYQSAFLAFLHLNSYIDKEVDDKINKLYEDLFSGPRNRDSSQIVGCV